MDATSREAAERFVLDSVRAWVHGETVPAPPADSRWISLAAGAGVLATVADGLLAGGHELAGDVRSSRLAAALTSMRMMVEFDVLRVALSGTRWVVLKGPVLADLVYRTRSSRTYDDLDVLVHPRDLPVALSALEAAGMKLIDRNWPMIARMGRGEISLRGVTGINIDLHWHPINDSATRSRLPVDLDDMLRRAEEVQLNGRSVPSLEPTDLVVYVALHASLSGGHRLRWLLDLQQAVLWSGCTPEDLAWRARVHGLGLVVRTMLDRSATFVDASLAPFAAAAGPVSPWTGLCHAVSRAEPPLSVEWRRSGRSVFAATRRSSLTSAHQFATSLLQDARDRARHRDASAEVNALMSPVDSPADRQAWLVAAAACCP